MSSKLRTFSCTQKSLFLHKVHTLKFLRWEKYLEWKLHSTQFPTKCYSNMSIYIETIGFQIKIRTIKVQNNKFLEIFQPLSPYYQSYKFFQNPLWFPPFSRRQIINEESLKLELSNQKRNLVFLFTPIDLDISKTGW